MTFVQSGWLFAIVIAGAYLEEAVWLPDWSLTAGRWHHAVGNTEFQFAVIVLTLLAVIAAWLATVQGRESFAPILSQAICLPELRDCGAGASSGAADRRRLGDTGTARPGASQQILRSHAALSAVADLCPPRRRSPAFDARRMGRRRLLVA
jgi:hypothetical protein